MSFEYRFPIETNVGFIEVCACFALPAGLIFSAAPIVMGFSNVIYFFSVTFRWGLVSGVCFFSVVCKRFPISHLDVSDVFKVINFPVNSSTFRQKQRGTM